ncbi:MAG: hypothetical protein ACOCUZ_01575, partial [bacterium]
AWTVQGLVLENRRESLTQTLLYLGRKVGPGELRFGARIPLQARNLPAGHALTASYFTSVTLW